jgi:uncharacterized protein (TIGR02996 family)
MTSTLTHDALLAAICEDPTDPLPRLAMMDYWKEQGDELRAEAWEALEGKYPWAHLSESPRAKKGDGYSYWWYCVERNSDRPDRCTLSKGWADHLDNDSKVPTKEDGICYIFGSKRRFLVAVEGYVRWKGGTK